MVSLNPYTVEVKEYRMELVMTYDLHFQIAKGRGEESALVTLMLHTIFSKYADEFVSTGYRPESP